MQSFAEYLAESAELFFPFCVLVSKLQSLEGTLIELDFVQNYFLDTLEQFLYCAP